MKCRVSAPGKVLLCGGYLIVESGNSGVSIATDSRFSARVERCVLHDGQPSSSAPSTTSSVIVHSPQFGATYQFNLQWSTKGSDNDEVLAIKQVSGSESEFILHAVIFAFASVSSHRRGASSSTTTTDPRGATIEIVLEASNDFYSQREFLHSRGLAVTADNLRKVPPLKFLGRKVSKTGLGSSAALTASLVGCIHAAFCGGDGCPLDVEAVHRVAQVAHCVAQGKIGSGFDVYTAVYGSCIYKRFDPQLIRKVMSNSSDSKSSVEIAKLAALIDAPDEWVERPQQMMNGAGGDGGKFALPTGLHLMLGDIHRGGTATPKAVAKILAWRRAIAKDAGNLWEQLRSANAQWIQSIQSLRTACTTSPKEYSAAITALQTHKFVGPAHDGATTVELHDGVTALFDVFFTCAARCRVLLREMGSAAGVEIEPKVLTPLLDATAALPGVIAVGCPGAGGYDAVFALVVGGADAIGCRRAVEEFWETFPLLSICPLLVSASPHGMICEMMNSPSKM